MALVKFIGFKMGNLNNLFLTALLIVSISACSDGKQETTETTAITKKTYSIDDWRRDFTSVFETRNAKTDGGGITEYSACFNPKDDKCEINMVGMKDGFRKLNHLTTPLTYIESSLAKYKYNGVGSYIGMRIVAVECEAPTIALNPVLFGKEWLFMNQVAFMGDGVVLFEKHAEHNNVQRTIEDGITEDWAFAIDESDYQNLKKFSSATSKVIRLSGKNGYVTMKNDSVKTFADDFPKLIQAIDIINKSLNKSGGPHCVVENNTSKLQ